MTARITQLIARYVGVALAFVAGRAGVNSSDTDIIAAEFAALAVALGALIIDGLLHRAGAGSFLAPAGGKV